MALCLLYTNKNISQTSDEVIITEDLDEVVISIPFNESEENNIINVTKVSVDLDNPLMFQQISKSIEHKLGRKKTLFKIGETRRS